MKEMAPLSTIRGIVKLTKRITFFAPCVQIIVYPGWGPWPKVDMSRPKWTHKGVSCVQNYTVWKHDGRTKVWSYVILIARRTHIYFWTHESLDIGTFRLGWPGHKHLLSGTVWIYGLSVWDLNLGIIMNDDIRLRMFSIFLLLKKEMILLVVSGNSGRCSSSKSDYQKNTHGGVFKITRMKTGA